MPGVQTSGLVVLLRGQGRIDNRKRSHHAHPTQPGKQAVRHLTSAAPTGPTWNKLPFPLQGPYTLAAAGLHSPSVHLWDARRGPLAVAELVTPGKAPLQGPVEMSPDGLVLFGLAQGNQVSPSLIYNHAVIGVRLPLVWAEHAGQPQLPIHPPHATPHTHIISTPFFFLLNPCCPPQLLLWDVRKGSSSGAVLNFGATGPYHHALLAHYDLNGPLSSAMSHFLAPLEPLQQQAQEGGGGVGGLERAQQGLGVVAAEARDPLPPPPVVDQVLLDPADPSRLGLVMQVSRGNTGAAGGCGLWDMAAGLHCGGRIACCLLGGKVVEC